VVTLYLANLPRDLTVDELRNLVAAHAPSVGRVSLGRDEHGTSRGYGFADLRGAAEAAAVTRALNGAIIEDRAIQVSVARPKGARAEAVGVNLFVGNLDREVDEAALSDLFAPYAEVLSAQVLRDHVTGVPRGAAFVRLANDEGARAAIAELDTKVFYDRPLRVQFAKPREPRRAA
jgi:RNA recognition motif-containing protein